MPTHRRSIVVHFRYVVALGCIIGILLYNMTNVSEASSFVRRKRLQQTNRRQQHFQSPIHYDDNTSTLTSRISKRKNSSDSGITKENISFDSLQVTKTPLPIRDKGFTRAAVVYLPNDGVFIAQLRWFYRSWIEMAKYEKEGWHTDLIVFVTSSISVLQELNCTNKIRTSKDEPNRCIVVENYVSANTRYKDIEGYQFTDSIDIFSWKPEIWKGYDWLLRTDIDVFLTPMFASWRPKRLVVGGGAYCFPKEITCHRLRRIARDMNLTDSGKENIGSTWYGPSKIIQDCAKLSVDAMRYIHKWEFSKLEYSKKFTSKFINWPEWHHGVLTLYGGQVAINHCTQGDGFDKRPDLLDVPTTSSESVYSAPHLHTWQNARTFSKFEFMAGSYKNVNISQLNVTKISDFAMYIALDAHKNISVGS